RKNAGRFLVTTAWEDSWVDDEPVLFLGNWCRLYSRRERWSAMDAEVLPWHWADRARYYTDYDYVVGFYERALGAVGAALNAKHGVDYPVRYWRILVGPWLGHFIQILFDRWLSIEEAVRWCDLSGTILLTGQK